MPPLHAAEGAVMVPHHITCACKPCCTRRVQLRELAMREERAGRGEVFKVPYHRPAYLRPGTEQALTWRYGPRRAS